MLTPLAPVKKRRERAARSTHHGHFLDFSSQNFVMYFGSKATIFLMIFKNLGYSRSSRINASPGNLSFENRIKIRAGKAKKQIRVLEQKFIKIWP